MFKYAGKSDGEIKVRLDSKAGPVISSIPYKPTSGWDSFEEITSNLAKPIAGKHDVYFYAEKPTKPNAAIIKFGEIKFK